MQTPDTSVYMIAGFVVIFTGMLVYLASLVVRFRNLRKDEELLAEIKETEVTPNVGVEGSHR
jgi:hypothetical protein